MAASPLAYAPWPSYSQEEIDAVSAVIRSGKVNYWTGTEAREFEREFAATVGVKHAIFVANGTVALELALRALKLPSGSEVITTPRTFIASSSAIVAAGLRPVFADVDALSGCITPASIEAAITPRTSAALVVHLGGWPADMVGIRSLCDVRGLALIEDCSQAHGAMIGDAHVGTFGDVAAWSFCQDKIITTGGEGGMVASDDEDLWRWMWSYKDHGKSWEAVYERDHLPGFRWLHESFGTNWRGTEMQAAIGRIQYAKLPTWHAQRSANAAFLAARLANLPGIRVPMPSRSVTHAYYRLYAYVDSSAFRYGWTRDRILVEGAKHGVPIHFGSCSEIFLEQAFVTNGWVPAAPLPNARRMTDEALAFLVHPGLTECQLSRVCDFLAGILDHAFKSNARPSREFRRVD